MILRAELYRNWVAHGERAHGVHSFYYALTEMCGLKMAKPRARLGPIQAFRTVWAFLGRQPELSLGMKPLPWMIRIVLKRIS